MGLSLFCIFGMVQLGHEIPEIAGWVARWVLGLAAIEIAPSAPSCFPVIVAFPWGSHSKNPADLLHVSPCDWAGKCGSRWRLAAALSASED